MWNFILDNLLGWMFWCMDEHGSSKWFFFRANSFWLLGRSLHLCRYFTISILCDNRGISKSKSSLWILHGTLFIINTILSFSNCFLWEFTRSCSIFLFSIIWCWRIRYHRHSRSVDKSIFERVLNPIRNPFFSASASGPSVTYAVDVAGSVPVGSATTSTPTLTLAFNTNTNTFTSSGWEDPSIEWFLLTSFVKKTTINYYIQSVKHNVSFLLT